VSSLAIAVMDRTHEQGVCWINE